MDGLHGLQSLKALIAARNRICILEGLTPKKMPSLETLVLSHNQLEAVSLEGFKSLKKVSVAQNRLHAFPKLQKLPALAELRLNGNHITSIPALVLGRKPRHLPCRGHHIATLDHAGRGEEPHQRAKKL